MTSIALRPAKLPDIKPIIELIRPFSDEEIMLPLSFGSAVDRIRDFWIAEMADVIVGVGAVHPAWDNLMEIRSLAVRREMQHHGIGRLIMQSLLENARHMGAREVFTLTYVPTFFERFGFKRIEKDRLPRKVWADCVHCPKFPDCGEIPLLLTL